MITRQPGSSCVQRGGGGQPVQPGISMSSSATSGWPRSAAATTSSPRPTWATTSKSSSSSSSAASAERTSAWSSASSSRITPRPRPGRPVRVGRSARGRRTPRRAAPKPLRRCRRGHRAAGGADPLAQPGAGRCRRAGTPPRPSSAISIQRGPTSIVQWSARECRTTLVIALAHHPAEQLRQRRRRRRRPHPGSSAVDAGRAQHLAGGGQLAGERHVAVARPPRPGRRPACAGTAARPRRSRLRPARGSPARPAGAPARP